MKTESGIKILIDGRQDLIGIRSEVNPLPQIASVTIEQGLIGRDIDVRIPGLSQQPRPLLHIEVFPVLTETESQEPIVGGFAGQVVNDLLRPPPQNRIPA